LAVLLDVSQSMISQMEKHLNEACIPIPHKPRELGPGIGVMEPSIHDQLVEYLTEWSDEELKEMLQMQRGQPKMTPGERKLAYYRMTGKNPKGFKPPSDG
jgi:hypothetical protein